MQSRRGPASNDDLQFRGAAPHCRVRTLDEIDIGYPGEDPKHPLDTIAPLSWRVVDDGNRALPSLRGWGLHSMKRFERKFRMDVRPGVPQHLLRLGCCIILPARDRQIALRTADEIEVTPGFDGPPCRH